MKRILALLGCVLTILLASDEKNQGTIDMKAHSSDVMELRDILNFEGIDYYKLYFTGSKLKDKNYCILAKEIQKNEIINIDTLVDTRKNRMKINGDTLKFRIIAKKTAENKLRTFFRFPRYGVENKTAADNKDYSFRILRLKPGIKPDRPFYAFAFIPPYETQWGKSYCKVTNSNVQPEKWGGKNSG